MVNLCCAQVNSASYSWWVGKWVVAYGLWGEGLVRLIGVVVCLLAASRGSKCSLTLAMDGRIVHCGISSCQSARLQSASVCESVSCNKLYSKYRTLLFTFYLGQLLRACYLLPGWWHCIADSWLISSCRSAVCQQQQQQQHWLPWQPLSWWTVLRCVQAKHHRDASWRSSCWCREVSNIGRASDCRQTSDHRQRYHGNVRPASTGYSAQAQVHKDGVYSH